LPLPLPLPLPPFLRGLREGRCWKLCVCFA